MLGISTWSPPKSLGWRKGFRLGSDLTWKLLGLLLVCGSQLAVTCKRTWCSTSGNRRDFVVGCTLTGAVVTSCAVQPDRWIVPHLAVRTHFEYGRWACRVTGRARHPGPPSLPCHVGVEFLNVGGWLTHGDFALVVGVDFLAVVEHRLIPARVRSEGSRGGRDCLLFGL